MSPKFMKPTLGRANKSGWEEHTSKLGVHVAGPHHDVEGAEMARGISSAIIGGEMGYLEPWWKGSACDTRCEGLELLIRVFSTDPPPRAQSAIRAFIWACMAA